MSQEKTCAELVQQQWAGRKVDLEIFMNREDPEEDPEDIGLFQEYGLHFDYLCPYYWTDQTQGYWRYQISYGGPCEEIRIYGDVIDDYKAHMIRAEFWFLDWGDGACVDVSKEACVRWLFDNLTETGTIAHTYHEGMKNYEGPPAVEVEGGDDDDNEEITKYFDATVDGWFRITVVSGHKDSDFDGFHDEIDEADLPADFSTWKQYDTGASGLGMSFKTLSVDGG